MNKTCPQCDTEINYFDMNENYICEDCEWCAYCDCDVDDCDCCCPHCDRLISENECIQCCNTQCDDCEYNYDECKCYDECGKKEEYPPFYHQATKITSFARMCIQLHKIKGIELNHNKHYIKNKKLLDDIKIQLIKERTSYYDAYIGVSNKCDKEIRKRENAQNKLKKLRRKCKKEMVDELHTKNKELEERARYAECRLRNFKQNFQNTFNMEWNINSFDHLKKLLIDEDDWNTL